MNEYHWWAVIAVVGFLGLGTLIKSCENEMSAARVRSMAACEDMCHHEVAAFLPNDRNCICK